LPGRTAHRRDHPQPDPTDRRKLLAVITDPGRAVLDDRAQTIVERLTEALAPFDKGEQLQIAAAVPLLEELADRL
jgi:DNA-binding MarR family transcriptional regulator